MILKSALVALVLSAAMSVVAGKSDGMFTPDGVLEMASLAK